MPFPPAPHHPPAGAPAEPPGRGDPGHFSIGGKRVSWDALFIAGGGILAVLFMAHRGGGGGSGPVLTGTSLSGPATTTTAGPGLPSAPIIDSAPIPAPPTGGGAVNGPDAYVAGLYGADLHRAPDAAGAAFWTQQVQNVGAAAATTQFLATPEAQVQAAYGSDLGRAADPGGLTFWEQYLAAGHTAAQLDAAIKAGPEYRTAHG